MSMVHSSIAAEALSLSGGCEVTIYINRLVSEILQVDGSQLNIIAYTDNQSLYDAVHSMKQTFEKRLIVDISSIWGNRSSVSKKKNEIEVTWIEKERKISDVLSKTGVSSSELLNMLSTAKMIIL